MPLFAACSFLARPVLVDDITVGTVVDVLFDGAIERALGFEVRCGDGEHRFLPFGAASTDAETVRAPTPLALLDRPELAFYERGGRSLRALRGSPVDPGDGRPGELHDLRVASDAVVTCVVTADRHEWRRNAVGITPRRAGG